MIARTLHDGSACAKFQQMLTGQGVDPTTAHRLCERDAEVFTILPRAKCVESVRSDHTGQSVTYNYYISYYHINWLCCCCLRMGNLGSWVVRLTSTGGYSCQRVLISLSTFLGPETAILTY